jgi:hypothetical protein
MQDAIDKNTRRRTQLKGPKLKPSPDYIEKIPEPFFSLSQDTLDIIAELPPQMILPLVSAARHFKSGSVYGNGGYSQVVAQYIAALPWWDGKAAPSPFGGWYYTLRANERTTEIRVCWSEFFRALDERGKS